MKLTKEDIDGKKWAYLFDNDNYAISSNGILYSFISNKTIVPAFNTDEYICYAYRSKDKTKSITRSAHIMVIKSFYPELINKKIMITHKDNNRLNNDINNLEYHEFDNNKYDASKAGQIRYKNMSEKSRQNMVGALKRDDVAIKIKNALKDMWSNVSDETRPVIDGYNWKYIKNTDNGYAISRDGKLFSIKNDRLINPRKDKDGYIVYNLTVNGITKTKKAHRLVAIEFIPNDDPENKIQINHKNEIRDDNRVENLEWCDNKYNNRYGTKPAQMSRIVQEHWDNMSDDEKAERFVNESRTKMKQFLSTIPGYRHDDPIILTRYLCYYCYKLNYKFNYKTPYNLSEGISYYANYSNIIQKDFFLPKYTDA